MPKPAEVAVPGRPLRRGASTPRAEIGARGLRTHLRIIDAGLQAFGEAGYDRTTLDRVAELAGCSRVAIYQYVSGKDELFRVLAGQAARQMGAALEALGEVTPDEAGRAAVLAYVERLGDITDRYGAIIEAFGAAAEDDETLAASARSIVHDGIGLLAARVVGSDLPPRLLGPTMELLNTGAVKALCRMAILRAADPVCYARERMDPLLADVLHRALFGLLPGVNDLPPPPGPAPSMVHFSAEAVSLFERAAELEVTSAGSKRALGAMLRVANGLIAERAATGIRIDDIVAAAGVSRGSFYTYFDGIDDFVRLMGIRAIAALAVVVRDLPDEPTLPELGRWLRRFSDVNLEGGPLMSVWGEAVEGPLRRDAAAAIDFGRRRFARLLRGRGLDDADLAAALLLQMVEVFASSPRSKAEYDAFLSLVDRGYLAVEPHGSPENSKEH
jgi:AcrR family transcriptional regulator